jgi:opacity protein-like surface antigen
MTKTTNTFLKCFLLIFTLFQVVSAQSYNSPLTMQGLNHATGSSVASVAMGGITLSIKNDVSLMFSNPASLQTLEGIQISVVGLRHSQTLDQSQQWFPLSYYSNFSLLMQGLSRDIPDPDTILNNPPNAGDSVQRPFDAIGPNWKHTKNKTIPIQVLLGVPFSVNGIKCGAGLGVVEYANLNYFYQNNNVLSPDFGSFNSGVFILPTSDRDVDAKTVYWSQVIRERINSIYGYGGAISAALSEKLSVGISGMLLKGQTNDYESVVGRGVLRMHRNFFGVYPNRFDTSRVGTSDFSGYEFTISGAYNINSFSIGFSIKPPTTITRDYSTDVRIDTAGVAMNSYNQKGTDKLKLPWRPTVGIGVVLRKNLSLALEYEYLPYGSAEYHHDSVSSKPWIDCSSWKLGIEYLFEPWLVFRVGYSTQMEVFQAEGNFNEGDPVASTAYSCGIGCKINNIRFNVSYEYLKISYEDKWATNVNINNELRQNFNANVVYTLPW